MKFDDTEVERLSEEKQEGELSGSISDDYVRFCGLLVPRHALECCGAVIDLHQVKCDFRTMRAHGVKFVTIAVSCPHCGELRRAVCDKEEAQ